MSAATETTIAFGKTEPFTHWFTGDDIPPQLMDAILATSPPLLLNAYLREQARGAIAAAVTMANLRAVADYAVNGSCADLDAVEISVLDSEPGVLGPAFKQDFVVGTVAAELSVKILAGPSVIVQECPTEEYVAWLQLVTEYQYSLTRWMASMPRPTDPLPTPPEEFDGDKFTDGKRKRRDFTVRWYLTLTVGPLKYSDSSTQTHTVWTPCCESD